MYGKTKYLDLRLSLIYFPHPIERYFYLVTATVLVRWLWYTAYILQGTYNNWNSNQYDSKLIW